MGFDQSSKYCKNCGKKVLAQRKSTRHLLHLLLTILTGGLWLIVWLIRCIRIGGWRCSQCGSRVGAFKY